MKPSTVRGLVMVICVGGIAGMIIGSIADNNAVAMTFGLLTAAAVLCLIVATAVSKTTDAPGEEVEARVASLVAAGADEGEVRGLVRAAVQLGQQTGRTGR